jgi:hypothetical protein
LLWRAPSRQQESTLIHRIASVLNICLLSAGAPLAHGQSTDVDDLASGAATSITRSATWADATPLHTALPPRLSMLLRPQDVISYAAPGVLFPARNIGLQCQGVDATLVDIPKRTAHVKTKDGAADPRFGEAAMAGSRVFRLQAGAGDVLAPGTSARCELVFYPMPGSALPQNKSFWLAFSFWADDWSGTNDEQLIAQLHVQEPRNILLNPFFALVVRGGELRVELRHNDRDIPDQASTKLVTAARVQMPVRKWSTVVVQARIGNRPEQEAFVRLWLNGKLIADHAGPLGYILPPGGYSYAKVGVYHWAASNPWDMSQPTRAMLVGAMLTVNDETGRYSSELIQAAVTRPELH